MIKVLIAEDEALVSAGIRAVLEAAGDIEVVAEAAHGRIAVDLAIRHRVDVVLTDIHMPQLDGIATLNALKARYAEVRVVMLTSFGDEASIFRALRQGAVGFVLKASRPDELIEAIRAAYRGDAFLSPAVTRIVLAGVTPDDLDRRHRAEQRLAVLSSREREVLNLVAKGLSNAEIGTRLYMSEPTIKTYVSRILRALGCSNRVQAALLARDAATT